MNPRIPVLIVVAAVVAGLAGFATSQLLSRGNEEASAEDKAEARRSMTSAEVGSPIPEFELPDVNGVMVSSKELTGKPLLINFWATWCAPCRREMPHLMELQEELGERGTVVGIALDDVEAVREYVDELGIEYPILVAGDLDGTRLAQRYGNRNVLLPYSVFVAADGRISDVVLGEVTLEQARERLSPHL